MEITIKSHEGELNREELEKLLQTVRDIEQADKKRLITVFINAPNMSTQECRDILSSIKPGFSVLEKSFVIRSRSSENEDKIL